MSACEVYLSEGYIGYAIACQDSPVPHLLTRSKGCWHQTPFERGPISGKWIIAKLFALGIYSQLLRPGGLLCILSCNIVRPIFSEWVYPPTWQHFHSNHL